MNRRNFLQILATSGAFAATFDVEKLLWTPKPMIVVPDMSVRIYGNLWLEDWGAAVCSFINGRKIYLNQYEIAKTLEKIYKEYAEKEAKYSYHFRAVSNESHNQYS